ncbi:MAG: orotidine-5'-phosphate decarboxylase [Bacteroidota bacterium]|nr:orotidine-5'-phosphate decarboxylase [Bacteroidota bacterium]
MTRSELFEIIKEKESFLCIGLDSDIERIPKYLLKEKDPIFAFNKQIIDATHDLAISYKPNIAFYESLGPKGWESLAKTMEYLEPLRDKLFLIADAKRGDIGNTSKQYAHTFFDKNRAGLNFDSVTVAPYMGSDSVEPFLEYKNKWVVLLALTSNMGAYDFQLKQIVDENSNKTSLYEEVLIESQKWANEEQMMYVVGATKAYKLQKIREMAPNHFLLIPGVGAQGGSLEDVANNGMNDQCGLIVNSSRGIIFASNGKDFASVAREKAKEIQLTMSNILHQNLNF